MVLKNIRHKLIGILLRLLFLDFLIFFFSKVLYFLSKLLFLKEWQFSHRVPMFFKHQINLNNWRFDPKEWSFVTRGVFAREKMLPNSKVLDLCCGDGTYSYLFFADIAASIDAVDFDETALSYARKYYKHPKINFKRL